MNKLEKEIIINLRKSKYPIDVDKLLQLSKITKHSRRLSSCILGLEDKKIVFIVKTKKITRFNSCYGLVGYHTY